MIQEFLINTPYYAQTLLYMGAYICISEWNQPWIFIFVIICALPVADQLMLPLTRNIDDKELDESFHFKFILYLLLVIDWAYYSWFIHYITKEPFDLFFWTGSIVVSGLLHGHHFTVTHDLTHKEDTFGSTVGFISAGKQFYSHAVISHVYGHHKDAGTPIDPATARLGESLYKFLPRSILGGYLLCWQIEKRRLVQVEGYSTQWHLMNRMIWSTILQSGFAVLVFIKFGFAGLLVSICIGALTIIFLEAINYINHYAAERKEVASEEYEPMDVTHSWDSPHRITNYLLLNIGFHSSHHLKPYQPYQNLKFCKESPKLPQGYYYCLFLSFFPLFWFKIINPYVLKFKETRVEAQYDANSHIWMLGFYFLSTLVLGAFVYIGIS